MTSFMLGLYGLYFIAVGVKGNTSKLVSMVQGDAAGFVPWLVIVAVLDAAYEVPALRNTTEAFAVLIAAGYLFGQRSNVVGQVSQFYSDITGATAQNETTAAN
jgi:hypothetical protein